MKSWYKGKLLRIYSETFKEAVLFDFDNMKYDSDIADNRKPLERFMKNLEIALFQVSDESNIVQKVKYPSTNKVIIITKRGPDIEIDVQKQGVKLFKKDKFPFTVSISQLVKYLEPKGYRDMFKKQVNRPRVKGDQNIIQAFAKDLGNAAKGTVFQLGEIPKILRNNSFLGAIEYTTRVTGDKSYLSYRYGTPTFKLHMGDMGRGININGFGEEEIDKMSMATVKRYTGTIEKIYKDVFTIHSRVKNILAQWKKKGYKLER